MIIFKIEGLHVHDAFWESEPEVTEAIRRYRLADPYGVLIFILIKLI